MSAHKPITQFVEHYFLQLLFKRTIFELVVVTIMRRIGRSYIKSKRKQLFVFITIFAFLLTITLFCLLRGSLYIVLVTLTAVILFELVAYLMLGLLSKMGVVVKLLSLSILILAAIVITIISNKHGYVRLITNSILGCRLHVTLHFHTPIILIIPLAVPNTPPSPSFTHSFLLFSTPPAGRFFNANNKSDKTHSKTQPC